jgi:hypothetical protein
VLFLTLLRSEATRAGLAAIAEAVAVDRAPVKAPRTRVEHVRNGVGAMLAVSSRFGRRPTPLASLMYLRRGPVRSELGFGLDEFARALAPPRDPGRQRALAIAAVPSTAAILAIIAAARRKRAGKSQPVAPAPREPVPANAGS